MAQQTAATEATFENHDVVDVTLDDQTIRGVFRRTSMGRDEVVAHVTIPRTHDAEYGEHLDGDAFVDDTEVVTTLDHVEVVARPDVSSIDPRNYSADRHLELAEQQGLLDDENEQDGQPAGWFCTDCEAFHDSVTPVNTGHATTGEAGCPECLSAESLFYVVEEVGNERTVTGGYVPSVHRDEDGSISLQAATEGC